MRLEYIRTPPPLGVIRLAPVTAILCSIFARTILGRVPQRNSPISRLVEEVVGEHARFLEFFESYEQRAPDSIADFVAGNPQEMPLPGFVAALVKWTSPT